MSRADWIALVLLAGVLSGALIGGALERVIDDKLHRLRHEVEGK